MTREEAIRILDPETTGEALAEIEYYGGFSGKTAAVQAVSDACILAVSALREQEQRRWIPVTERLPEADVAVLARCFYHEIWGTLVCRMSKSNVRKWYTNVSGQWVQVTHWMPLPQPPKGE